MQLLGLHSLRWRRLRANLITAFKIFTSVMDIDANLICLPPSRRGKRGHPYKVVQGKSHRRRRGSAFSAGVVKYYWNKLPASALTATSFNIFKKRWDKVWTEAFPRLPHWLNAQLSKSILPPISHAHHPLKVIISICYPTPYSVYVVSSGQLWSNFYNYKW